jgi:serine O-acetyltransferase
MDDGTTHGVSKDLVYRLVESILDEPRTRHMGHALLPSRDAVAQLVDLIRKLAFPGYFGRRGLTKENIGLHVEELVATITLQMQDQIASVLRYTSDGEAASGVEAMDDRECARLASELTQAFLEQLPTIRRLLALDVQAAYDGDPAAHHTDETIICYPGVEAIFSHRVANELYRMNVPLLPRIIQEMAHSRTGIDIHPGATIGESFFIDHGGAVVIGETTEIGHHVRIYQGVTLGARRFEKDANGRMIHGRKKRHPTIGNRVTIYAGAVILGGDTVIGDDCVISGSVFLTKSVPAGHMVRQVSPELVLRSQADLMEMEHAEGGG